MTAPQEPSHGDPAPQTLAAKLEILRNILNASRTNGALPLHLQDPDNSARYAKVLKDFRVSRDELASYRFAGRGQFTSLSMNVHQFVLSLENGSLASTRSEMAQALPESFYAERTHALSTSLNSALVRAGLTLDTWTFRFLGLSDPPCLEK